MYIVIVRAKKIENDDLQGLRVYEKRKYHSKSSRNTSKQSSAGSKSKSKQRKLRMEDLNNSDHHMYLYNK